MNFTTEQNLSQGNILNKQDLLKHYSQVEVTEAQERITEKVILIKKQKKNNVESNNIVTCLKNHFIFYNLTEQEIENVKEKMYYAEVKQNQTIFTYEDNGNCFFIVQKGSLQLTPEDRSKKKILKPIDGFGQLALLYNTQRNSEVVALENCSLWVIDRLTFRKAVEEMIIKEYTQNKKCFENVRFFSNLTPDHKDIIASSLIRQKFYKGQVIIQQGDPGSTFYYIKDGSASVYKSSNFHRKLTKGDSFGQQSLYYNTMRQYTIKADQDSICLVLGRDTLNRIMGDNIYQVTFKNFIRWAFQKNSTISQFTKQIQDKIIDQMKISSFKAQQLIFKRGVSSFQKLVVVIQGKLKKVKKAEVVATKGQCYGLDALKDDYKGIEDDQIIMENYGVIAEISENAWNTAVNNASLNDLIAQKKQKAETILEAMEKKGGKIKRQKDILLQQLKVTHLLTAKGQFGPLYVLSDDNNMKYLLKIISKQQLKKYDVQEFAIDEGNVLANVSSPFIITMHRKFQTHSHIFYINELVEGGDLYQILKSIGLLSTQDSQFYTANIILILEYFAQKGIICRDIKPQNFMVDSKGYLKLINLPTAKIMKNDSQGGYQKTYTIIGTPHYMAPDIVIGKGYNNMVDLWSLGICLYQFLCGTLPFGDESESAYEIYEDIMQTDLKFPQFLHDKKAKKLIEQLLSHNSSQRNGGSFQNLKNHSWFQDFKWNSLLNRQVKQLKPPALPQCKQSFEKKMNIPLMELINDQYTNRQIDKLETKWENFGEIIL